MQERKADGCSDGSLRPETKKSSLTLLDEGYFSPIVDVEEELIQRKGNLEIYLGNLRKSKSFKVLPLGYLVLLDSDHFNQMRNDTEDNFVYVRMLRKIIKGKKKLLPVCLRCNDNGKAQAIIFGSSHILPDDSLGNELNHCKHEAVSQLLYTYQEVVEMEDGSQKCVVLKNTEKLHISACHDGKSYATIVCRIGRQASKGKCCSCKGTKCGHEAQWNKDLKTSVLKTDKVIEEKDEKEISSSSGDDEADDSTVQITEKVERSPLKFPPTESAQILFRKFESE